jgi:oxalate decarboxylase
VWPPETDSGRQPPFKYSFSLAHKRIKGGDWTRQVTVSDLPISQTMAGVEMRLISGGIRELHWHVASEWALMLYGSARSTAVDQQGRAFVEDVNAGDLWLFPGAFRTRSRAWGRMDTSFCWCSRMATSMSSERFC